MGATSPTSVSATVYPAAGVTGPYTVTATPIGGGSPITVTCATPDCPVTGLAPGTTYEVTATGTGPSGAPTPVSPPETVTTPAAGSPVVDVQAVGPTSVAVDVTPASGTGGPYTITATPVGGGSPVVITCPSDCTLTGLDPNTTYAVTVSGTDSAGKPTPPSAPDTVTTPQKGCALRPVQAAAGVFAVAAGLLPPAIGQPLPLP